MSLLSLLIYLMHACWIKVLVSCTQMSVYCVIHIGWCPDIILSLVLFACRMLLLMPRHWLKLSGLKGLLQSGQIPGRELRSGITFNSFPTKHGTFRVSAFSLLYTRGPYHASPEWVWKTLPIKNTDQEDTETSNLICNHMHIKIMWSSTLTAYKWKQPNVTEWNVDPGRGKGLCKLWECWRKPSTASLLW